MLKPPYGITPDERRRERKLRSRPIAEALKAWAEKVTMKLSDQSDLAAAFRYMRSRWLGSRAASTTIASASTTIPPNVPCAALLSG